MITPPQFNGITVNEPALKAGDRIFASVVKSDGDGNYILNTSGRTIAAMSQDNLPDNRTIKLSVLKTEPLQVALLNDDKADALQIGNKVAVKLLSVNSKSFHVEINGRTYDINMRANPSAAKFMAEVIKTDPLLELKEIINPKTAAISAMAREMASFNQRETAAVLKDFGASKISAFMASEIERLIKDGGMFMENKILRNKSLKGDMKLASYGRGNGNAASAISKLQIANALMGNDFFSFLESDELDFDDGIIRISRNEENGWSFHVKLTFTKLGDTVVSFLKSYDEKWFVTVRTKNDISSLLSRIYVKNCKISWKPLKDEDKDIFIIKHDIMTGLAGFETVG